MLAGHGVGRQTGFAVVVWCGGVVVLHVDVLLDRGLGNPRTNASQLEQSVIAAGLGDPVVGYAEKFVGGSVTDAGDDGTAAWPGQARRPVRAVEGVDVGGPGGSRQNAAPIEGVCCRISSPLHL